MKKILLGGISVVMACAVTVGALCGCAKQQDEPDITEFAATPVDYNDSGVYTTELSGADFSGIQKSDVKVLYTFTENTGAVNEPSAGQSAQPEQDSYDVNKAAEILDLQADSLGMTLSFKDGDAKDNFTDYYTVIIENRRTVAAVDVLFEEHTLLSAVPYVLSSATDIDLTLTLDGEFKELTADDIALSGSFEGMTVAENSISYTNSADSATLSFKIQGELKKDETANLYPRRSCRHIPQSH